MEKFRSFIKKHLVISIIISVIIYPLLIIWPIVYFDKIVKHKKLLYLGILLFFIFIISGVKSVKNNTSTEYDYDACEHYANILINNTKMIMVPLAILMKLNMNYIEILYKYHLIS